jgi:hypothetical protein
LNELETDRQDGKHVNTTTPNDWCMNDGAGKVILQESAARVPFWLRAADQLETNKPLSLLPSAQWFYSRYYYTYKVVDNEISFSPTPSNEW